MQNSSRTTVAIVLIGVGALFLTGNILGFNAWRMLWPAMLIGAGLWVITRQGKANPELPNADQWVGEVRHRETGMANSKQFWLGAGDVDIDLTGATFPAGVTTYRVSGLVADVDVKVPAHVGVRASFSGVAGDLTLDKQNADIVFGTGVLDSANYASAERKLHLDASHIAGDITVHHVGGGV